MTSVDYSRRIESGGAYGYYDPWPTGEISFGGITIGTASFVSGLHNTYVVTRNLISGATVEILFGQSSSDPAAAPVPDLFDINVSFSGSISVYEVDVVGLTLTSDNLTIRLGNETIGYSRENISQLADDLEAIAVPPDIAADFVAAVSEAMDATGQIESWAFEFYNSFTTADLSDMTSSANIVLAADVFSGNEGAAYVNIGEIINVIGTSYDDIIIGSAHSNILEGGGGSDSLDGGDGADILRAGDGGGDTLSGGAGADRLYYADGMVTLEGGEGNDYYDFSEVTGTDRGATIILSGDFGHDMMSDRGNSMDRLVFSDVNFADVSFSYDYTVSGPYSSGYDTYWLSGALTITVDADNSFYIPYVGGQYVYSQGDWWTPEGYFSAYLQSPFTIEFADQSFAYWEQMFDVPVWEIPQGSTPETAATALSDHEAERTEDNTGDEDELLIGSSGSDNLTGGSGNDTFSAGTGDDVIAYSGGDDLIFGSNTTSINSGHDTLDLSAYTASEVSFTASGNDALIETPDGTITLEYQLRYEEGHTRSNIEAIIFSDTTLDETAIHARALADQASDGDDLVQGTIQADTFYDTAGNDTLVGGGEDDLFVYQSGNDMIGGSNATAVNTGADTLDLSAYSSDEVRFAVSGHDALIVTPDGTIELDYQLRYEDGNARSNIETIIFADITLDEAAIRARALGDQATDASEAITGTIQADVLHSGAGDDTLTGGQGVDVFVFAAGDGNDRITDFTLGSDLLQVEATGFETLTITQIGTDVRIDYSESDSVVLANLDVSLVNADMFAFA